MIASPHLLQKIHRTQVFLFVLFTISSFANPGNSLSPEESKKNTKSKAENWFKNRPVKFLENKGQMMDMNNVPAPYILFKAEAPGVDLYITEKGLTYVFLEMKEDEKEKEKKLKYDGSQLVPDIGKEENFEVSWERLDMNLPGANIKRENIIKEKSSEHFTNYYYGFCPKGIKDVKEFEKITIKDIYPGIDWVFYNSSKTGFKYDFIVHPGADASQIKLLYSSLKPIKLNEDGNLTIKTKMGQLTENAPYSYLQENNQKIESSFKLLSQKKVGKVFESIVSFNLGSVNLYNQTLIIDPQLVWSTFYGGTSFEGTFSISSDNNGNIFMCGYLASTNFPVLNSGTYFLASGMTFILKFTNNGVLLWATYFGANNAASLVTDNAGNLFLTGQITGSLFPTMNAGTYFQGTSGGASDAFITKFDNLGNILWSTYYGGSGADAGYSIAKDNVGNIFLSGTTSSTNFPVQNAGTYFQGTLLGGPCGFVAKFDNMGNSLWSTYYHGINGQALATDQNGNVFMTGMATNTTLPVQNPGGTTYFQATQSGGVDAYVIKFDNSGNHLWSTYYGGSFNDAGTSITTDKLGNVFVMGTTASTNFPVQNAGTYFQGNLSTSAVVNQQDIFVLKFNNSGTRLWATYFGGKKNESIGSYDNMETDSCGSLYIAFGTQSSNVPTSNSCLSGYSKPIFDSTNAAYSDIFLAKFTNTGVLSWGTYFGGDGNDFRSSVDVDVNSNFYVTGEWALISNPMTYTVIGPSANSYTSSYTASDDVYIAKFLDQAPNQSFSYTPSICKNDTNRLPVKSIGFINGGNYSAVAGLSINPVNGQISPTASIPGTYTVSYSLSSNCFCSVQNFTTAVTIQPSPSLSISPNSTICVGNKIVRTVNGANTYTWNTGAQTNTISVSPTLTTIYTATATGTNGCKNTATTQVVVNKCLGVNELSDPKSQLRIYPNPNTGEFTIEAQQNMKLNLVNELGQLIKEIEFNSSNERKINITNLAEGIYFLIGNISGEKINYKILVAK